MLINYQSDFLLSRNSQSSTMKILYHHSWLFCFCSYLLPFPNKLTRKGVCYHCLKLFSPHSHSSASNCFWLRSLMGKVTQLPLTCFQFYHVSPLLDMSHPYFYNPSFLLQQHFFLLLLLISTGSIIHLNFSGPRQHCQSDLSSCLLLPDAHHTSLWMILQCLMDNSQLVILFIPDCSAQNTFPHPSYRKSPIYSSITAQISTLSVSCSSQCFLCIILRISDFNFFQESTLFIVTSPAVSTMSCA